MSRVLTTTLRAAARPSLCLSARVPAAIPSQLRFSSSEHGQETFESFTTRYTSFFQSAQDLFEVQRGLNNCFAHDLVPAPEVIEAALRAARRVNDYATAVRIFEGIKEKVENKEQYKAYLQELKPVREELGMYRLVLGVGMRNTHIGSYLRHRHKRRALLVMRGISSSLFNVTSLS